MLGKNRTIKILLIEDDPGDALLIQEMLGAIQSINFDVETVTRLSDSFEYLESTSFDVIISDMSLPDASGIDTISQLIERTVNIPIVVLSGQNDEDVAIRAVHKGAQDYLVKSEVNATLLSRGIQYAIERKRSEVELKRVNLELQQSNNDLQDFTHAVSHDLKEPLRKIISFGDFLIDESYSRLHENDIYYIQKIQAAATRMRDLIHDLLDISRVGSQGTIFKNINVNRVIADVLEMMQFTSNKDNTEFIDPNENIVTCAQLPEIYADRTQVSRLFQNLISNSIKYKKNDTIAHIQIHAQNDGKFVTFSVEDNGIGIEKRFWENIFVIFKRLHTRDTYPGTGIGLTLCKKIVERHGGKIWCESEFGKGSTFYFQLIPASS